MSGETGFVRTPASGALIGIIPDASLPAALRGVGADGFAPGTAVASGPVTLDANASAAGVRRRHSDAAATQTLTAAQSGTHFRAAVDAVFTLPASATVGAGVEYTFECGALSTGTGLSISPAAADAIYGNGLTSVVNKDLINTGASDRLGDMVTLISSGVAGTGAWAIKGIIGTWAKEA